MSGALSTERPEAALARLIAIARGATGQSARVRGFLLAWWNAEAFGGFDITDLWAVDADVAEDMAAVFAMVSWRRGHYPEELRPLAEAVERARAAVAAAEDAGPFTEPLSDILDLDTWSETRGTVARRPGGALRAEQEDGTAFDLPPMAEEQLVGGLVFAADVFRDILRRGSAAHPEARRRAAAGLLGLHRALERRGSASLAGGIPDLPELVAAARRAEEER